MSKSPVKLYTSKRNGGFTSNAKFPAALSRHLVGKHGNPVVMDWEIVGNTVILTPRQ